MDEHSTHDDTCEHPLPVGKAIRCHILPALGQKRLTELRPDEIQCLYAAMLTSGQSPRSVEKIHVVLHRALKIAVKWGRVPRNVVDAVDKPTAPKFEPSSQTSSGLLRKLAIVWQRSGRWRSARGVARASCLASCGQTLTSRPVRSLSAAAWSASRTRYHSLVNRSQAQAAARSRFLPTRWPHCVLTRLIRQLSDSPLLIGLTTIWCSPAVLVLPLIVRNVIRDFKRALTRAGLSSNVRFHDLRHAHATLILRAGVPLKIASSRLGHSGIGITGDLYQHWAQDMDKDAAERAANVLRVGNTGTG
jgi:integrase